VNLFHVTIFGFTAWRVCAATVLVLVYVGLRFHWRQEEQRRAGAERTTGAQANKSAGSNGSTLRTRKERAPVDLTDTQRIDHLHRSVSLQVGEHADLKELTFGRLPKLRVAFAGVEHSSGQEFAHIKVELGGATADCGKSVQELGENDFLVPRTANGDQHSSIHYTCGKSDAVSFLQVKVLQFDAAKKSVSIDVLHVRGRRAA
jgi:hypothetical protein